MNFRTACEVADVFAKRLGLDEAVRAALAATFERWNGRGLPTGAKGTAIPRPMRIAQLSQELEVLARVEGIPRALEMIGARRGKAYDPDLTDLVLDGARAVVGGGRAGRLLGRARSRSPRGVRRSSDAAVHESLLVLADFADLKSPWTSGHSRAVAALAREACGPAAEAAALVHDLGCVAVPNTIWDKPGPLTRDERDRAETHALVTDQLLRRVPYTATLGGRGGRGARARRRVRLPPTGHRRAPRRGPAGHRRRGLLPGHDVGAPASRSASHPRMPPPSCEP